MNEKLTDRIIENSLETHVFVRPKSGDDYYCAECKKPRALHLHTGFQPTPDMPKTRGDQWMRPGTRFPSL